MTFDLNFKSNIDKFQRDISAFAYKQLPFATAQALTEVVRIVVTAEQQNEEKVLDRPKPFTKDALGVIRADKRTLVARMFMKDITARYLEPYQFGGRNVLNSRALLKPIEAVKDLDQYGNLPRNFLKKLKGRSDVFIGPVQTRSGPINGVWQRTVEPGSAIPVARIGKDGSVRVGKTRKNLNTSGKLHLLVRFTEPHEARQYLDWFGVAEKAAKRHFNAVMGRALARAIATAK